MSSASPNSGNWRGPVLWSCVFLYMTFIFWLSGLSELPGAPSGFPFADKVFHATLFMVLGVLMYAAMRCSWARMPDSHVLIFALGAVVIYGISDEIHQGFVSMREPGILDLLADSIGGFIGILLARHFIRRDGPGR